MQQVATYRDDDTDPKEQFVNHNAGLGGYGGSSAIDGVILRDKDDNAGWASAADGTLEERYYYCQNWRGDVVEIMDDSANQIEHIRHSSSGVPIGFVGGDVESDGDMDVSDTADSDQFDTWIFASHYDARADMDRDGDVDAADKTLALNNAGVAFGRGVLSGDPNTATGNRKGYAGYEFATSLSGKIGIYDVRNRFLIASLGRWTRRDPPGYVDGANLYEYVRSSPLAGVDPFGNAANCAAQDQGVYVPEIPSSNCLAEVCDIDPHCCEPGGWDVLCQELSDQICPQQAPSDWECGSKVFLTLTSATLTIISQSGTCSPDPEVINEQVGTCAIAHMMISEEWVKNCPIPYYNPYFVPRPSPPPCIPINSFDWCYDLQFTDTCTENGCTIEYTYEGNACFTYTQGRCLLNNMVSAEPNQTPITGF